MAKWLKDYLSFGSRRMPPQPPKPDYTESEILKAYRAQKKLDFEDPYEDSENRARNESGSSDSSYPAFGSPLKSASLDMKVVSPKHRLIKMDSQDLGRTKILLSAISLEDQEPVVPSAPAVRDADYSDPFDAHTNPRPESDLGPVHCENNGYMEPYEAQRVITELQHGPGVGRTQGEVQLYDTPYEKGRGRPLGVGLGYSNPLEEGRESRLPQDDERPADEYDQPWEWKKENISKAFADMSELPELPCPPPVGQQMEEDLLIGQHLPRTTPSHSPTCSLTHQPEPPVSCICPACFLYDVNIQYQSSLGTPTHSRVFVCFYYCSTLYNNSEDVKTVK
ncbi:SH2 domain-containing adapter protein D isoform X3 [Oncorhynchus mykiss]|uniref:SH2 domain-containing adapter protein D isoform X3 n=1 Tax=Oncorhynchus mykiss TaxID=8022 RepID=UPI001877F6CF|nr:SH2 domain-containing adapter protein D isoform X3 [Oncorhynchus mykiss]